MLVASPPRKEEVRNSPFGGHEDVVPVPVECDLVAVTSAERPGVHRADTTLRVRGGVGVVLRVPPLVDGELQHRGGAVERGLPVVGTLVDTGLAGAEGQRDGAEVDRLHRERVTEQDSVLDTRAVHGCPSFRRIACMVCKS